MRDLTRVLAIPIVATVILAAVLLLTGSRPLAQSNTDSFFDAPPIYQGLDYSAIHYRYKDMALGPTGDVLMVFEEFDPTTDRATGRIAVQWRNDTRMVHCIDAYTGIPVVCGPGAVIR